jgi:histidyl-tRNA synthetase
MAKTKQSTEPAPAATAAPAKPAAPAPARPKGGPEPRLAKGFRDIEAAELRATWAMVEKIRAVYERYGFEPLDTPAFEYTDALGKFLPDSDRPNEGVFSLQDEDEQWMSLRYDLTAPLARYVAENFNSLPKPFRRYAFGTVWRNEKPGPGRFRQFMQFDADTVGTESVAADAECCMLLSEAYEALGIARGGTVIKLNSRKVLDGVLEGIGIAPGAAGDATRRLAVMRAIDKFDKFGAAGVALLLGRGRKDESGDFTAGAGLEAKSIDRVLAFLQSSARTRAASLTTLAPLVSGSSIGEQGIADLAEIDRQLTSSGFASDRVIIDASIVRGLEYYTGAVYEAELTTEIKGEDGEPIRLGSVGSGGRYDDLVARFTGEKVPATGASIGVSRLLTALKLLGRSSADTAATGPVVVLVMDKAEVAQYQRLTQTLRAANIRAEMYLGSSGMKAQMKYADKRGSPVVVIQGSDERARGEVTLKDLVEGAKAAAAIKDNKEWKEARPAQVAVPEARLVEAVREIISRHS